MSSKSCIKKNVFRSLNETPEDLYKKCKYILKSKDLISLQNCLFMYKLKQYKELPKPFAGPFHTNGKHK